jgi:hypothetical protein
MDKLIAFLKPSLYRWLWPAARIAVFISIWWSFIRISGWYYFHYIDDIGFTYWAIGLITATPLVLLIWIIIDIIFSQKGTSIKKLWIILCLFLAINILLLPLWFISGLIIVSQLKSFF